MSCCGSRRQTHRAWLQSRPVRVQYLGIEPTQIVGQTTGNSYSFTASEPVLEVDAHDARALLQTQSFVVAKT